MNIHELSAKTKISLTNLRKLEKLKVNFAKLDPESDFIASLRIHLARGQGMTVKQLLTICDDMDLLDELEMISRRHAVRAAQEVIALGAVRASEAPADVTAAIERAARGDTDAVLVMANWAKSILPPEPVNFAWLAVRLLIPLNEYLRNQTMPLLTLAFLNMRKLPEFAGYWHSENIKGKNVSKYHQPLASLDL